MSTLTRIIPGNVRKFVSFQTVRTLYNANSTTNPCYASNAVKFNLEKKSSKHEKKLTEQKFIDPYERYEKMDQHFEVNVTTPNQLRSVHVTFH